MYSNRYFSYLITNIKKQNKVTDSVDQKIDYRKRILEQRKKDQRKFNYNLYKEKFKRKKNNKNNSQ